MKVHLIILLPFCNANRFFSFLIVEESVYLMLGLPTLIYPSRRSRPAETLGIISEPQDTVGWRRQLKKICQYG